MANNGTSLEGMQELLDKLEQLGKEGKKVESNALKKAGNVLKEEIIKQAPERTGNLKKNIVVSNIKKNKEGSYVQVGTNNKSFYGKFVEFGTTKMAADPFMSRSFESKKDEIQETIATEIKRGVKEE